MRFTVHQSLRLGGTITDVPTPFDDDGRLDLPTFRRLCARQIENGIAAIVVADTAGEASTLTPDEHAAVVRAAVGVCDGRIAVIAGAGSNATSCAIELTRQAEAAGADAVLSVVPYYNKPMQEGLLAHFRAIAASTGLPVILHDTPARTVRGLDDTTIARLSETPQFIGLKDSSGDVMRPLRLRTMVRPDFRLLSGDDATATGYLLQGGHGVISMTSNVAPTLGRHVHDGCLRGAWQSIHADAAALAQMTAALSQEAAPSALKYALSLLGLMSPRVRLPIVELTRPSKAIVAVALAALCDHDATPESESVDILSARQPMALRFAEMR